MALTAQVKSELSSTTITKACCRKAEVASVLRFAGGLHIVAGRVVVEAELDTGAAARRLRKDIAEIYGHDSEIVVMQGSGLRKGTHYIVRIPKDGEVLARLQGIRGLEGLTPSTEAASPQLAIRVDRQRASDLGLSVAAVGATVRTALDGSKYKDW